MRLNEIAKILNSTLSLDEDIEIKAINSLKQANKYEISFFHDLKLKDELLSTKASAILIKKEHESLIPKNCIGIFHQNPYLAFAILSKYFAKPLFSSKIAPQVKNATIMKNANISNGAIIDEGSVIFSGVFIGENVKIGKNCEIYPNVVIYNDVIIGDNCKIHANAVIGSDGFGYAHDENANHIKIYHNGNVIIENCVEIGAGSTIDRGVFGNTIIKKGTKIDNLVQIGHNCELDERCIIVAQTGLAGSSKLGKNVIMGGQSATAGHLKIGDFATIAARGGVTKDLQGGKVYSGVPAMPHEKWLAIKAILSKLYKKQKQEKKWKKM